MLRRSIFIFLCSVSVVFGKQVSVDTSGSDSSGDGSVTSPFRTIQFAIEHNNTSNGDIILVSPGIYKENINFRGKNITVGSLTLTTGDRSYILQTIIDGGFPTNSDSSSVATFIGGETSAAKLVGFTLQNGNGLMMGGRRYGGGIYTKSSSPSFKHLLITNNATSSDANLLYGAGIYFDDNSDVIIDSSEISNNGELDIGWGGGIHISKNSDVSLENTKINNNKASLGGGIYIPKRVRNSNSVFKRVEIISNKARNGGGIWAGARSGSLLKIYDSKVLNNIATNEGGGFYLIQSTNKIELNDILINGNSSAKKGGGIFVTGAKPTIKSSLITGNQSESGGAIYIQNSTTELSLINTIFYDNKITSNGSVIYGNNQATVKIYHSTISNNSAPEKSTLYLNSGSSIYLYNSILCSNEASKQVIFGNDGATAGRFEAKSSIIEGLTTIQISDNQDIVSIDNTSFSTDPLFTNPNFNDFTLKNNSPAIGYGTNDVSFSPNSTLVGVDFSGNSRPTDSNPDIGAYENNLNSPANSPPIMNSLSDIKIDQNSDEKVVNLTGILDGDYHSEQSLIVTAKSSNTTLMPQPTIGYSSPATTGTISFKPAPDNNGDVFLTVKVTDDGGTANTGVDTLLTTFKVTVEPIVPDNFKHSITDKGGVVQGTPRLNGIPASTFDWIAAFDNNGNSVGSAKLTNLNNDVRFGVGLSNFILYGDDPTSSEIDEGMNQNEYFTLRLWDASRNLILIQIDSLGDTLTHSGWTNTNFTPISGYDDPTKLFQFYYNADPIIEECLVKELKEDTPYDFNISDLKFSDDDDISDDNLKITVFTGENYSLNGTVLRPNNNYNGTLTVPFQISDGLSSSNIFTAEIKVLAIDDPPEIAKPIGDLKILEDATSTYINLSRTFTDVDNKNSDITKSIIGNSPNGKITASISGDSLTLNYLENQNGNVTIIIEANSNGLTVKDSFSVNIFEVNDSPIISNQDSSITVMEDSFKVLTYDYYNIKDVDNEGTFSIVIQKGNNYTFSGDTLFPVLNYVGNLTVNVQPDDGSEENNIGATFLSKVTVLDRNDPPEVTNVAISPSIVEVKDTLNLSYNISDPEGSTDTTISISWYKNNILSSEMNNSKRILPVNLSCGDSWFAEVSASDGLISSDPVSSNKVVICKENTAPIWLDETPIEFVIPEDSDSVLFSLADYIIDEEQALSQLTFESNSTDISGIIDASIVNGHYLRLSSIVENYFTPADSFINLVIWADDGYDRYDTTSLNISIDPVNDPPVILEFSHASINEDSLFIFSIDSVDYDDPENDVCTLFIKQGNYYSIYGDTITPNLDFYGELNVPFAISDGELTTDDTLKIKVVSLGIKNSDQEVGSHFPRKFALHPNYPNPFNPSTTISYDLSRETYVRITIYDITGKRIRTLINKSQSIGTKKIVWDGMDDFNRTVSGGVYLYSIEASEFRKTHKMLLLK
tara:strand:+ start:223 stop:4584 length:4362 start_codon:yes stop_codon:yes gene_type:complete